MAGGIGAGKSALTDRLASLGYDVIDADTLAHRVTEKGRPAWIALRDAFGDAILAPDGELDRAFLAEIVFSDQSALRRLNMITHGDIAMEIVGELDQSEGDAVFVALPLYQSEHREALLLDQVWAVEASPETAVRRLCELRGFSERDARARIANQMTNEERGAIVDRVFWNDGPLSSLYAQLDAALVESGLDRG